MTAFSAQSTLLTCVGHVECQRAGRSSVIEVGLDPSPGGLSLISARQASIRGAGSVGSGSAGFRTRVRFEDACGQIGVGLADMGFRYLKSKREARKASGEWTQVVSFQSSFRNTADHVQLWVWYWIDSDEVGRRRQEQGATGNNARVFGCALGYLGDPAMFVDWNVAGDSAPVIRDVVDRVRRERTGSRG